MERSEIAGKIAHILPYADVVTLQIIYRIMLRRVDLARVFGGGK